MDDRVRSARVGVLLQTADAALGGRNRPIRSSSSGTFFYHGPRKTCRAITRRRRSSRCSIRSRTSSSASAGNCDCEVDQMVLQFPILADYAVLAECGRRIYLTHGHVINKDHPLPFAEGGHPAPRPHARAGLRGLRHIPLSEPRLGVHPQKRLAPQLYDARERPVHLEGCHHRRTLAELEPLISDHRFRPSKGPLYQGGPFHCDGMGRPSHGASGSKRPPRRFSKAPGRLVSISITALHTPWRSSRRRARC